MQSELKDGGRWKMGEIPGWEKFSPAQLVFLALGFLGPQQFVSPSRRVIPNLGCRVR